jgi:hypothetical protein
MNSRRFIVCSLAPSLKQAADLITREAWLPWRTRNYGINSGKIQCSIEGMAGSWDNPPTLRLFRGLKHLTSRRTSIMISF